MALTRRATALCATICMGLAQLGWAPAAPAAEALAAVSGVQNHVQFRGASAPAWAPAAIGRPIGVGDSIQTGPQSKAEITYQDGTIVRLASSSTLTVLNQERRSLQLLFGKLWAKVTKRGRGMSVHTPAAIASITGTEFILEVMPDQSTHLTVVEGTVLMFPLRGGPGAPGGGAEQGGTPGEQPGQTVVVSESKEKTGPQGQGSQETTAPGEHAAAPPGGDPGPRPQLDMGGFQGNGPESVSMKPVSVSAGQGLIARPESPLKQAFTVDTRLVQVQEAPFTGGPMGREHVIDPGMRGNDVNNRRELRNEPGAGNPPPVDRPGKHRQDPGGPVAAGGPNAQGDRRGGAGNERQGAPQQAGTPTVSTRTELENQRIDPKNLGGSPTTGTLQILVK